MDESKSYADLFRKIGISEHGHNYKTLSKVIEELNLDCTKINENRKITNYNNLKALHSKKSIPLEDILNGNDNHYYNSNSLKNRLIKSGIKEYKCECCGLSEWLGNPIPLQLHHEDGNHNNNILENLKLLCPNCHALTDTYAGKNAKEIKFLK